MAVRAHGAQVEGVAPDGAMRWRLTLDAGESIVGELCPAANSAVFVRTTSGLRAISAEGRWAWKADLPLENLKFDADHYGPAALTDSSAVVLVDDRGYRAYSATGQQQWQFDLPDGEFPLTPPRSSPNGQVYVSSNVGLYSIGPNGKAIWRSVR
jgi:outer membrane protein assembly factor BamB